MSETMTRSQPSTLVLNAADNIAVALANLEVGISTPQGPAILRRAPKGHKFATRLIATGEPIRKFGQIIGFTKEPIVLGDWVHEHNCDMDGEDGSL